MMTYKTFKKYVLNRQFFLGAIVTIGFLSPYILGANSPPEEVAELLLKITTGIDVNFSGIEETIEQDLNHLYIRELYETTK